MWRRYLRFWGTDVRADVDAELGFHLEQLTEQYIEEGLSPHEARRKAEGRFGDARRVRDECVTLDDDWEREKRWRTLLHDFRQDLVLSLRALDRNRGFACAAILTLALGIGANTAIFSIVDNLLLKPLPVEDPERLVLVTSGRRGAWGNIVWEEIRDRELLEQSFAFATARLDLADAGEREPVESAWVSGSFFEGLGVLAVVGRTLGEHDDRRGGGADGPVAVISHRFWQREYDGARDVVGRSVSVSRVAFTIVGVVQPGFHGPEVGKATDLYLPIAAAALLPGLEIMLESRMSYWLRVMGRRAPDQSVDAATAALQQAQPLIRDSAMRELQYARDRERFMSEPLTAEPASGGVSAPREIYGDELVAAMVVVALLLLIACINVANLLLARAAGRRQEFGIRRALGASRLRLIRQLLAEGALLSSAGVLLGLLSGLWISRVLTQQLSVEFMMSGAPLTVDLDLALDWRLLLFASVLGAITTLLFATAPAWSASRVDPNVSLAEQRRGFVGAGRRDAGHALVLGQIALSLVLLVACGLFIRSFYGLATTRLGFTPSRVLVVNIDSRSGMIGSGRGFATLDPGNAAVAFDRFRDAITALPGVAAAAWSVTVPINGSYLSGWVEAPGLEALSRVEREVYTNLVTPGWFDTLGTRLIAGRDVDARDRFGSPRVAVVNEAFARKFFRGANPVGQVIRGGWPDPQEIVGLVEDAVYRSIKEPVPETLYQPIAQLADEDVEAFAFGLVLTARPATATPSQISRGVAAAIVAVDPEVSLTIGHSRSRYARPSRTSASSPCSPRCSRCWRCCSSRSASTGSSATP